MSVIQFRELDDASSLVHQLQDSPGFSRQYAICVTSVIIGPLWEGCYDAPILHPEMEGYHPAFYMR